MVAQLGWESKERGCEAVALGVVVLLACAAGLGLVVFTWHLGWRS